MLKGNKWLLQDAHIRLFKFLAQSTINSSVQSPLLRLNNIQPIGFLFERPC
jgi:hypothetical protein